MVHPEGNKEIAQLFVRSHMRKVAEDLKEECRYFWLEQYRAMVCGFLIIQKYSRVLKEHNMIFYACTSCSVFETNNFLLQIIVGPGLEVLGLFMKETNKVLIKPTNTSDERTIRDLCRALRDVRRLFKL